MKKPYKHTDTSHIECLECGAKIKMNLVARKLNTPPFCYKCYCAFQRKRGHLINHQPRRKRVEAGLPVKQFKKAA